MFFNNWAGLGRVALISILAYMALILLLRVSGKRTLSKMNAFDLVVTVALGSTLATIILSKDVALAEGVLALGLLILLQFIITWLSVRSATISHLVKAEPALLYHHGEFLWKAMKAERVTEDEVRAAVRAQGIAAMEKVMAVVLETDASFTVISYSDADSTSALHGVANSPVEAAQGSSP
ncbi:MAG: DUF421 domain-containing protein [Anaerolineae bacterium]|nr:DUF421 domain-containing protein [Anaerolineae bacterium]